MCVRGVGGGVCVYVCVCVAANVCYSVKGKPGITGSMTNVCYRVDGKRVLQGRWKTCILRGRWQTCGKGWGGGVDGIRVGRGKGGRCACVYAFAGIFVVNYVPLHVKESS